ncbi:FtsX-like permease family protein [Dactylosporangium sp. NPDC049525]|uniref:ABC transporter permease n=1 Tax=Dactylosporangium sp. NPDC049525 TaxID=3154730 RepID=UPI00341BD6F1
MNLMLGIRMAFGGGREAVARMALMTIGVAVGVMLLLLSLTGLPISQRHVDRLAWHRTDSASPATAPDPALWLAVTDRYAGKDVIRVHVAALGERPPVPPGVGRLPGPGEVLVSPALAELLRSVPDDQLRDRFPGRIVGTIGDAGLIMPDELVGIVGRTPEQMRATAGTIEIHGIEQPGERLDLYAILGVLLGLLAALIIGPVAVFVSMAARVGGVRREQRFAALRLAGATRLQTATLAATETAGAALVGIAVGCGAFAALRPVFAQGITLGHGMPIFPQDIRVPVVPAVVALTAVFVLAVGTALVTLAAVQAMPLGVFRRGRRRAPRAWRLLPLAFGILGSWYAADLSNDPDQEPPVYVALLAAVASLATLVGFFLVGAWVCHWAARGLARLGAGPTTLMVARRIAADPYSAFRSISGAALAMYVATSIALVAAQGKPAAADTPSVLDGGVVAVHVQGVPEEVLAPLMTGDVTIARRDPSRQVVISCADLAKVTDLGCPLPRYVEGPTGNEDYLALEDLFELPYPGASGADGIFVADGFAEPGPDAGQLAIQTLFIRTDGTVAAQERIRTVAAVAVPLSRSKTSQDLPRRNAAGSVTGLANVLPYAMVFVLLVAACSLTVSVINGVLERRRPFAVLRASGMRLGQLRGVVMLEIGLPLALSVLGGVGLAMLGTSVSIPSGQWNWPDAGFFAGLGAATLAAFAVSLIALPFMDIATRHDTVRFE